MNLQLKLMLAATKLFPNFNHSDYRYGASGLINPGTVKLISGIGPYRPEQGRIWLLDESETYWEVFESAFQSAV